MKRDYPFMISKILVGVVFIAFGLNFFLKFLPVPPPPSENGKAFLSVLVASGFLSVVKVLEIVGGFMVLSGRTAPLGLLILGPIMVCILLYHVLMAPALLAPSVVLGALMLFVAWRHRSVFGPFFVVRHDQCTFVPGSPESPKS
jgi:putative oxidoreductase